jgi:hypothetical protein
MTLSEILYLAALVVFALACRTYDNRYLRKAGWVALLAASYLSGYFLFDSHSAGAFGVSIWFLLPWLEIVGRVRGLRFPIRSEVTSRFPPSRDVFPNLDELSREVEGAGFEEVGDSGWKWSETDHFVRLFYDSGARTQASIALARQQQFAFSYVSLTSRTKDERTFTTTNYPFAPTMRSTPQQHTQRFVHAESMEELLASHDKFLEREDVGRDELTALDTDQLAAYIERDMSNQIDHNINTGLIEPTGDGEFRYSWRGCFFLWFQVVKDMIRV